MFISQINNITISQDFNRWTFIVQRPFKPSNKVLAENDQNLWLVCSWFRFDFKTEQNRNGEKSLFKTFFGGKIAS